MNKVYVLYKFQVLSMCIICDLFSYFLQKFSYVNLVKTFFPCFILLHRVSKVISEVDA